MLLEFDPPVGPLISVQVYVPAYPVVVELLSVIMLVYCVSTLLVTTCTVCHVSAVVFSSTPSLLQTTIVGGYCLERQVNETQVEDNWMRAET